MILLLALQLVDSVALRDAAIKASIPPIVIEAVAYMETRSGDKINAYRGPGREQCDSLGCRRVCREIGRLQINPCIRWSIPACDSIRTYSANLRCGAAILAERYHRYGSWSLAIRAYNGSGPMADLYQQRALAYIGKRALEQLE